MMDFKPAKRKKYVKSQFPTEDLDEKGPNTAAFNGVSCQVSDPNAMKRLFHSGFYGKGSLSRSGPVFNDLSSGRPEVLYEQQWQNRVKSSPDSRSNHQSFNALAEETVSNFLRNATNKSSEKSWKDFKPNDKYYTSVRTVIAWKEDSSAMATSDNLCDLVDGILSSGMPRKSMSETEDCVLVVTEDGPQLKVSPRRPSETLVLSLQETFFLAGALGRLDVVDLSGKDMNMTDMWHAFQKAEDTFIARYVVYHWYRSKGWIVRCGLKEGGDFVLYEKGPPFCHSSYVIRVQRVDYEMKWEDFSRLQRLVETFKKDIIVCLVHFPDGDIPDAFSFDWLTRCRVLEVMWRRRVPSQLASQPRGKASH